MARINSLMEELDEAEALRSEPEQELNPDENPTAWENGSDEEVEDVVIRNLAVLEAQWGVVKTG